MAKHSFFTNTRLPNGRSGQMVECRVDLEIDVQAVMQILGQKALRNKSKRSTEMSGLLKATVRVIGGSDGR